jgi:predicted transcriptional regulator
VHGLETDLRGTAHVVRLDLFSADGSAFFRTHRLGSVPAIVVLDPAGTVRYRANGLPNADEVRQAVRALTDPP